MNTELKNLVNTVLDVEKLVVDAVNKNDIALVSDAMGVLADLKQDASLWSDLMNEVKSLTVQANEQDLLAFVEQKLSAIPALSGAKPQAIMSAVIGLINAACALEHAILG